MSDDIKHYPTTTPCDMCGTGSIVRFASGYACYSCYIKIAQANADRYCNERGLNTTEEKIEHCRQLMRSFVANQGDKRAWMRNPKSDLAARYAAEVRAEFTYLAREPGEEG